MMDIAFIRESRLVVSFVYSMSSFTLLAILQCKDDTLHCFALSLIYYNSHICHMATYTIYTILIKLLYIISEYHWYSYIILLQKNWTQSIFSVTAIHWLLLQSVKCILKVEKLKLTRRKGRSRSGASWETKIFAGAAYRIYSNKRRGAYFIFRATCAALIRGRRLFEGGAYLKIVPDKFTSLYIFSTVHFLSVNFPMDWY